jgi:hypothetical protein
MRTVDWTYRNAQDSCPERPTWFVVKRKPLSNQKTMTTTKSNPVQTVQPDGYTTMLDAAPRPGAVKLELNTGKGA